MTAIQHLRTAAAMALGLATTVWADTRDVTPPPDISAVTESILRDARQHSMLLANEPNAFAGYDGGFVIRQDAFSMKIGAHAQFRNITDFRTNAKNDDGTDITNGFELRRLRLELSGSVYSSDLSYYIQWDADRTSGNVTLLDAWARHRIGDDSAVQVGQIKHPAFHEENVSDKNQLAVEKSTANTLLGGGITDRVQGVALQFGTKDTDTCKAAILFHDGPKSKNTDFTDSGKYWGLGARAEWRIMGDTWKSYGEFGARNIKADTLILGVGGDISEAANASGGGVTQYLATIDGDYKAASGVSAYAALLVQSFDPRNTADDDSVTNWGAIAQVSYELDPQWEIFGRYSLAHFENALSNGQQNVHEITAGVTHFLYPQYGHKAKITFDLTWLPSGAPGGLSGHGIQGGGDEAEVVARVQLNLAI